MPKKPSPFELAVGLTYDEAVHWLKAQRPILWEAVRDQDGYTIIDAARQSMLRDPSPPRSGEY